MIGARIRARIRANRTSLERDLSGRASRRYASPVLYGLETAIEDAVRGRVEGRVLDVGCGHGPYRHLLAAAAGSYESLDVRKILEDQTYVADVQAMPEVPADRYDAVLCSEVLEHVPAPSRALAEIHRVLRPDGVLVLTVPYLSRLHDEPHDYYRYTRHGLHHLLADAGFREIELARLGSVFSFAGHQFATVLVGGTWHLPAVRWLVLGLTAALVTLPARAADRVLGSELIPLGYVATARA